MNWVSLVLAERELRKKREIWTIRIGNPIEGFLKMKNKRKNQVFFGVFLFSLAFFPHVASPEEVEPGYLSLDFEVSDISSLAGKVKLSPKGNIGATPSHTKLYFKGKGELKDFFESGVASRKNSVTIALPAGNYSIEIDTEDFDVRKKEVRIYQGKTTNESFNRGVIYTRVIIDCENCDGDYGVFLEEESGILNKPNRKISEKTWEFQVVSEKLYQVKIREQGKIIFLRKGFNRYFGLSFKPEMEDISGWIVIDENTPVEIEAVVNWFFASEGVIALGFILVLNSLNPF